MGNRLQKLPKLNVPAPGFYNPEESFQKSQYEKGNKAF